MLNVFNSDAFNTVSMTEAIDKLPYRPKRLGQMGLFKEKGITTAIASVEERQGKLSLLMTKARGEMSQGNSTGRRKVRTFSVPHIPHNDAVMADEVLGVRKFGTEDELESVQTIVNDKLQRLKDDHEATWEWHRVRALHGLILEGDGVTPILDLFDAFGITETSVEFDFSATEQEIKRTCLTVIRHIETSLGDDTFTGVHAMCGDAFFDNLVTSPEIKAAYDRWQDGKFFREQQRPLGGSGGGFEYGGIMWENYRGQVGDVKFIADDVCRFFPTGSNVTFQRLNAPANFIEAVNTPGKALYAKQEKMKWDVGVELHTQSNPLFLCTRPSVLVEGLDVTPVQS